MIADDRKVCHGGVSKNALSQLIIQFTEQVATDSRVAQHRSQLLLLVHIELLTLLLGLLKKRLLMVVEALLGLPGSKARIIALAGLFIISGLLGNLGEGGRVVTL